ncbi:hypothetical protein KBC04_02710 [Candidatus Babeliales bacterium]|nr:hypothetical protein [Candidatus Babeliales bacterium]MBP9844036.1 hypothetical protein [Candidatus Babeliales bacterium]
MKELILKLTEIESIKIVSDSDVDFAKVDYCCGELVAYFVYNNNEFIIGQASAGDLCENFIARLQKNLKNELQIHESIKQNLGFMYNQYCHQLPLLSSEFVKILSKSGESSYWVGLDYDVWSTYISTKSMLTTWLYNDDKGNIIFEVTPLYQWSFLPDEPEDPDFQTYEEFMKDYKPLITRVIPRQVAIEWLGQVMKVYRGLFSTEENYKNMCKELGWEDC